MTATAKRPISTPKKRTHAPPEIRFWRMVDKTDEEGCWLWQGSANEKGYGRFYVPSAKSDTHTWFVKAHRFSWEIVHGAIPDGLWVLHKCDNPPCVNPSHLFLGTNAENMQDMVAKGRRQFPSGERVPTAKLTNAAVQEIRLVYGIKGGPTGKELAAKFGVHLVTLQNAAKGRTYR